MDRILELDPDTFTVTVEPGVVLQDLQPPDQALFVVFVDARRCGGVFLQQLYIQPVCAAGGVVLLRKLLAQGVVRRGIREVDLVQQRVDV